MSNQFPIFSFRHDARRWNSDSSMLRLAETLVDALLSFLNKDTLKFYEVVSPFLWPDNM